VYTKYEQLTGGPLNKYELLERLDKLDEVGLIYWPKKKGGQPRYKAFLEDAAGVPLSDVWSDIDAINSQADERIGYPTQKPRELMERIIQASSNKGDLVLDPFCGCGTTIEIADDLKRRWIGIDITHLAIDEVEGRLVKRGAKLGVDYRVDARHAPKTLPDIESMAKRDKHTFQGWALRESGIEAFQLKPGPDRGIDARKVFFDPAGSEHRREIIVSVKGGKLKANDVRDLIGTVQRERAQIGVLITLRAPSPNMLRDAADVEPYRGNDGRLYPAIQILTVADLLQGKVIEYPLQVVPRYEVPTVPALPQPRKDRQAIMRGDSATSLPQKARKMAKVSAVSSLARRAKLRAQ
jgi:site-specific DNA-methyltransferase (adenine-specific)